MILFFVFIFTITLFFTTEICKAKSGNTLYVGDTGEFIYSSIQDAINDSKEGDTVFIYDGNYTENIIINKSIILLGSNKNNVSINGNAGLYSILIKSSGITVSGITIQNSDLGIFISDSEYKFCNISNNIITNNYEGIRLMNSSYNNISNNIIKYHNNFGIVLFGSTNNVFVKNTFIDNYRCIFFSRWSNYNVVTENNFTDYSYGVNFDHSFNNLVTNNLVRNGRYGIYLTFSKDNNITNNSIEYNKQAGIYTSNSEQNEIFPNIFLNNYQDVSKESKPPSIKTPGFESLLILFTILFVLILKKRFY
jgi:parallel beta-helix repeat protein